MTPQELHEDRSAEHLSTAGLLAGRDANGDVKGPVLQTEPANVPLFAQSDAADFRSRWDRIQTGFVDEPRDSVQRADELVANAITRLTEVFAAERQKVESEWEKTDNVSTEDLRQALRKYRSFFNRLLSV